MNERLLAAYKGAIEFDPCPHERIVELFNAHNAQWPDMREVSTTCSGCVQRVFRRVKAHLQNEGLV